MSLLESRETKHECWFVCGCTVWPPFDLRNGWSSLNLYFVEHSPNDKRASMDSNSFHFRLFPIISLGRVRVRCLLRMENRYSVFNLLGILTRVVSSAAAAHTHTHNGPIVVIDGDRVKNYHLLIATRRQCVRPLISIQFPRIHTTFVRPANLINSIVSLFTPSHEDKIFFGSVLANSDRQMGCRLIPFKLMRGWRRRSYIFAQSVPLSQVRVYLFVFSCLRIWLMVQLFCSLNEGERKNEAEIVLLVVVSD